jgi:hypothetical protein
MTLLGQRPGGKSLKAQYDRKASACWEERGEPVFRVWVDGSRCYLLPFFSFLVGSFEEEHQTVTLEFGAGTVWITGPKAGEFCSSFCNHKATLLKADGKDILSVTFQKGES